MVRGWSGGSDVKVQFPEERREDTAEHPNEGWQQPRVCCMALCSLRLPAHIDFRTYVLICQMGGEKKENRVSGNYKCGRRVVNYVFGAI